LSTKKIWQHLKAFIHIRVFTMIYMFVNCICTTHVKTYIH
jgi:hypothetical protein